MPHVECGGLRVAEVFLRVAFVNAFGDPFGVIRSGPDLLALFGEDGRGAGILAHRQNSLGRDLGVFQQGQRDVTVVGGRLRIVEDRGDLLEVFRAQVKRGVVKRLLGEERDRLGCDLQDFAALEGPGADAFLREEAVHGVVGTERHGVLVDKGGRWHGELTFGIFPTE